MRTEQTHFEDKSRGRCYGDKALYMGFKQSSLIRDLCIGKREAPYQVASLWINFNRAIFTYSGYIVTRFNFGSQKFGLIFFCFILLMQLCIGSGAIPIILKPLVPYSFALLPIWYDHSELFDIFIGRTRSYALLSYSALTLLFGAIHLVRLWFVKDIDLNSSGESFLYITLEKTKLKVSESSVAYIEALLFLVIGVLSWRYWNDPYFGFFMIMVGICSWSSEFDKNSDIDHQKSISSI
ncbi:hypothetical protein AWW67_13330 [Roseivirga seohaensis]|uniref:Uncharacterized protein n=1 Tax=Roseivirga seohaensis TaxID=1914963 RepID=A0A150XKY5_9BACT|nr:hypothetical protein [Roseivirga seohaensis]KYG79351.1 hypothetical protein AWW67_13330 [Roseivirga seohaensis]